MFSTVRHSVRECPKHQVLSSNIKPVAHWPMDHNGRCIGKGGPLSGFGTGVVNHEYRDGVFRDTDRADVDGLVFGKGGLYIDGDDDVRAPNGSDNYCKYSRDLTKNPWSAPGSATIDDFETITFPASAAALDRVQYAMQDSTEAGGTYSAFIEVYVTSGTKDARVRMIDNAGTTTLFTDFTATTEKQWVPVDQITFDAASSFRALYIQNDSVGTAGELKVSNVIITSRPVRPENLFTDGAARIYELGNMCADAENIGSGSWVNGSLTVTPNYGVAPDGRQKTTLIDDQSAIASFNTNYTFPVADDIQPREASFFIRKQAGPISNYFGFRMQYQTGGSTINRFCAFDAVGGIVTAYNAGSELSVRVEDRGEFWRLVGTMSNNGTGNTELFCVLYPALNSDGTGAADVTATGSAEVWGFQVKDYDVESSNYCPAWGSARKLRFGEIWGNRVWMRFSFPFGVQDNGAVQVFYDDFIDSGNFNRLYFNNASKKIIFQKNVGGTPYTAVRDYAGDGEPFDVLIIMDDVYGMKIWITTEENPGTSPNTDDLPRHKEIRIGALSAGTVPLSAPVKDFKWGVLPARGLTPDQSCGSRVF